jgi:AcrR family transcriptional regulator
MRRTGKATKARIEEVSMRLFVDQGVTETTIRDIAGGAGIAEGTIYRHYRSKEDLVWELFFKYYTGFARALDELQQAAPAARGKIDAMVRGFCRLYDADPTLFRFLLIVQHQQLRKLTDDMPTPIKVLRGVVTQAMAEGEIPATDPDLATAMVLGVVLRPAVFAGYGRIRRPMIACAGELSSACWRVLNPPEIDEFDK